MSRAATAEISVSRYLDEDQWRIDTNDKRMADTLSRRGWETTGEGPYWTFLVPKQAVLLRTRKHVESLTQQTGPRPDSRPDPAAGNPAPAGPRE